MWWADKQVGDENRERKRKTLSKGGGDEECVWGELRQNSDKVNKWRISQEEGNHPSPLLLVQTVRRPLIEGVKQIQKLEIIRSSGCSSHRVACSAKLSVETTVYWRRKLVGKLWELISGLNWCVENGYFEQILMERDREICDNKKSHEERE